MNDESVAIGGRSLNRPANTDTEIDLLARETDVPRELVASLYANERARLERTARIKTYIPLLIHRHVKALLQERHRA